MKTDDLIASLASATPRPTPERDRFWAAPMVAAFALCFAGLVLILGAPLQPLEAIGPAPFVMKIAFAASTAIASAVALRLAGTPGRAVRPWLIVSGLPFAFVLVLSVMELAASSPEWPGRTWSSCVVSIAAGSLFTSAAAIAVLRRHAPTRLRLSGAIAGVFGTASAAAAYAFFCPETDAVFLLTWYAGSIIVGGCAGFALGPRLLRW